jgi:hypothetical protein
MTGRNPDGIEDFPSPDCSDVAYGPQRLNAIIGAYEAFLDPVCGTDDLSFHLVLELPATETPSARRHPPAPNWMIWWFPLHGRSTTDPAPSRQGTPRLDNASNPELRRRVDCKRVMTCEDYLEQVVNVVRRAMAACGMVVLEDQRVPVVRTSEFPVVRTLPASSSVSAAHGLDRRSWTK